MAKAKEIIHGKNIYYERGDELQEAALAHLRDLDKGIFSRYLYEARGTYPSVFKVNFKGYDVEVKLANLKGYNTIVTE